MQDENMEKIVENTPSQQKKIIYKVPDAATIKAQTVPKARRANPGRWPLHRVTFEIRESQNAEQRAKGINLYVRMIADVTDDIGPAMASALMSLPPMGMLSEEYKIYNLAMVPLDFVGEDIPDEVVFEDGEAIAIVVHPKNTSGQLKVDDKGQPYAEIDQILLGAPVSTVTDPMCGTCGQKIPTGADRKKTKTGYMCLTCWDDLQLPTQ